MALLRLSIPSALALAPGERVELLIGNEHALNLAASQPTGGRPVDQQRPAGEPVSWGSERWGQFVWGGGSLPGWGEARAVWGDGAWGVMRAAPVLTHVHHAADPCAVLPFGARAVDAAGNATVAWETWRQLHDRPRGARGQAVEAGDGGAAVLTWAASPHVS